MVNKCNDGEVENTKSKWVIRLKLSREEMLSKNITIDDVHFAIKNYDNKKEIKCVFSDFNANDLIFRIKINLSKQEKSRKLWIKVITFIN